VRSYSDCVLRKSQERKTRKEYILKEKFSVKIEGSAPLLMHRFITSAEKPKEAKKQDRKGIVRDPEQEAKQAAYILPNGKLYQPAEHIERAMVKAGTSYIIPGAGKKTYKDAIAGGVFIEQQEITHLIQKAVVDIRPVRVQNARIERARMRLDKWALEFSMVVTDERITPDTLKSILKDAGSFIGIGDYRPKFGRFEVTRFNKV
jgi:hypothetical protein